MKVPRVNDFDPKATPPLKSSLEDMPVINKPVATLPVATLRRIEEKKPEEVITPKRRPDSPPGPPSGGPSVRTPVRVKRTITRYAFEFFQDQIERLKQFSLDEQLQGEKGSMSQMVREALDAYIAKRTRTEG